MITRHLENKIQTLLPLYLTDRLSPLKRRAVEFWLQRSEPTRVRLDELRNLRAGLDAAWEAQPVPAAWPRLAVRSGEKSLGERSTAISPRWAAGMLLGVVLFVFGWVAVPPAVEIHWSVAGTTPAEFRIYRAEGSGSPTFELVEEIPADAKIGSYSFRDYLLIPGRDYVYQIEAVGPNDEAIAHERVIGDSSLVLPGQIALLAASLISLYGVQVFFNRMAGSREMLLPG